MTDEFELEKQLQEETGRKFKSLRRARGLSQLELAEKLGISYQQVQKYENGDSRIFLSRFFQMCRILGTNASELLADIEKDVAEKAPGYGPIVRPQPDDASFLTKDEAQFLKLLRRVENNHLRKSLVDYMKGLIELEAKEDDPRRNDTET